MFYLIIACVVFVVFGVLYNLAITIGLTSKPKDAEDTVLLWLVITVASVVWPVAITIALLLVAIWLGTKCSNYIANKILQLIKGKKNAS